MSLSFSFRRVMAGATASLALSTMAPFSSVQAQPATSASTSAFAFAFAPQLNNMCIAFNNTQRRTHPFDEALSILADKATAYSGWAELRAGLNANKFYFDGICPSKTAPKTVAPVPSLRGFAIRLSHPETGEMPSAAIVTAAMRKGAAEPLAEQIIMNSAILSVTNISEMTETSDRDAETLALLSTLALAYTQANTITFAVETALKNEDSNALDNFYNNVPQHISDISDLHATAIAAQKQGRTLNAAERQEFRDKILGALLKNPSVRKYMAEAISNTTAQSYFAKAAADLRAGGSFTPPQRKAFDKAYLKDRLQKLPGNIGKHPDAQNYISYWQEQRARDQDPMVVFEQKLRELAQQIKANENDLRKELKELGSAVPQTPPAFKITP